MDLRELAKEFTGGVKHMQLATVNNGQPWVCTVYFVADEGNNLYWMSSRERQHSTEIQHDAKAAATIVLDSEKKRAMQFAGEAQEVADSDLERVNKLYQSKFGPKEYDLNEIKKHLPTGRAFWVFKPNVIMFWDEVTFPDQPKQRLEV